jgi:hypothetical protein
LRLLRGDRNVHVEGFTADEVKQRMQAVLDHYVVEVAEA